MDQGEKERQILERLRIVYENDIDALLKDLQFLHELRESSDQAGRVVKRTTIIGITGIIGTAIWIGIKNMVHAQ